YEPELTTTPCASRCTKFASANFRFSQSSYLSVMTVATRFSDAEALFGRTWVARTHEWATSPLRVRELRSVSKRAVSLTPDGIHSSAWTGVHCTQSPIANAATAAKRVACRIVLPR